MLCTRLSSKGQIVLPKALRSAHAWKAGTEFLVEEVADGVLLRPLTPLPETTLEQVIGCAGYAGPRKTLEEMERAIEQGARRDHGRR